MNIRSFGSTSLAITFAASLLAFASAACTVKTTGTGPAPTADGGASSDDDDDKDSDAKPGTGSKTGSKPGTEKPSGNTSGSTCQQIFQCALECEDVDCEDACYAKGTPAGKAQVDALIACSQANECTDGECIIANCSTEYEACE